MMSISHEHEGSGVWWVNQGKSHANEQSAGIVFASSGGAQVEHHLNVRRMRPGDVVLHYWNSSVAALGQVLTSAVDANRPYELNGERDQGWLVRVDYFPLRSPIGSAELPVRPPRVGPFDRDGRVKFGYLYEVDRAYAGTLRERFADRWPEGSPWSLRPGAVVTFIPVEEHRTERTCFTSEREFYDVERREAALVGRYKEHLKSEDHVVSRLRVVPAGESHPIYSDLWDETARELIEAKGSVTRDQLRLAVGQLLDYGRFVDGEQSHPRSAPTQPRPGRLSARRAGGRHLSRRRLLGPEEPERQLTCASRHTSFDLVAEW
jgi:hypothetical protein